MVARGEGWLANVSRMNADMGDHEGPPNCTSSSLAPTDGDGLLLRLIPIGPLRSPQFLPSFLLN